MKNITSFATHEKYDNGHKKTQPRSLMVKLYRKNQDKLPYTYNLEDWDGVRPYHEISLSEKASMRLNDP